MFDTLYSITITQAAAALRAGELTSAALVRHALEAVRLHDGTLNAMLRVSASALEEAERCDAEAAQGSFRGPLHGIPLVIKDNIDVRGLPTTVASPLFTHAAPAKADAVAVARLRAAGAVIFGKTNLDELAAHVSGRTSCFGPTVNPWHPERRLSPGGSSSGTATAVAAGYCPGGLGTDTGGSIRLPAGWCGLYGIRSTQGQSDISGIYPRAASLDTVGAMARSARDIDLLLQILADPPLRDTLRASAPIRYLRIGVFPDLVRAKGSPEVIEAYTEAVGRWEEFGECIPVGLPLLDDPAVVDSVGTIRSYEFARDIRKDIEGNPFAGKMHPVPLADYKNGQQATPEAYHAALLHKQALSRQVDAFFASLQVDFLKKGFFGFPTPFFASLQVDFLLLPVAFSTAPSIDAPQEAFTAGRALVNLFSVAGVPTLVVPGELTAGGMPLGIQLVGPALSERLLLDAGAAYETTYGPFPAPPLAFA